MHPYLDKLLSILINLWHKNPTFYSTLVAAVIAAMIAVISIRKQRQTSREKNSLDFESAYKRSEKVEEAWQILLDIIKVKNVVPLEMWGRDEVRQTKEARALMTVFNEWERCANAIKHGLFDEKFLYDVFGSTVLFLSKEFSPYLNARRKKNIKFYCNFCMLAEVWTLRKECENGINAPKLPYNIPFTPTIAVPEEDGVVQRKIEKSIELKIRL